jgi:hypothetical protein
MIPAPAVKITKPMMVFSVPEITSEIPFFATADRSEKTIQPELPVSLTHHK